MNLQDINCCKLIETENFRARIYLTPINEQLMLDIQLIILKSYSDQKLYRMLKEQRDNVYEAFFEQYEDAHKWLISPEESVKNVAKNTLMPGLLIRLKSYKLPVCINYGFDLKDLYQANKLEKQLIIADCVNKNNSSFLTEWTLVLLEIIKILRDDPLTPYLDLIKKESEITEKTKEALISKTVA